MSKKAHPHEVITEEALTEAAKPKPKGAAATKKFVVELERCPAVVVEADSTEAAWEEYKKQQGILGSIHTPKVVEVQ